MLEKHKPKVSVIFPIYNNEKYLRRCISSVADQTLKDIELILIDDGSTDSAPQICDEFAARDQRVRVIHQENAGSAAGRNLGLSLASGEFVAFVESDDYCSSDMYELLYKRAAKTGVDIVKCGYYLCEGRKRYKFDVINTVAANGEIFSAVNAPKIFLFHASIWAGIYRREFLVNNDLHFIETPKATYSDFSWMAMTYACADSINILHKVLYNYNYDNPFSSNKFEDEKCFYKPYHCEKANDILRESGIFNQVNEEISLHEFKTINSHSYRLRADLRNDYFKRFSVIMKMFDSEGVSFKYFKNYQRFLLYCLLKNKKRSFWNCVTIINSIRNALVQIGIFGEIKTKILNNRHSYI